MNTVILTAAGSGTRMHSDIPKQFMHVHDKPIIVYTMEAFQKHPNVDSILVTTLDSWKDVIWAYAKEYKISKLKWIVSGGVTGQESIYNGLKSLESELSPDAVITVHDGNRPLVSSEVISDSYSTYSRYGSAVAVIPCTEVVFESENGVSSMISIEREKLYRTQTPHTYRFGELMAAYREAEEKGIKGMAASCMLMKELGRMTYFSKGSEENIKITTQDDLKIFRALLELKERF